MGEDGHDTACFCDSLTKKDLETAAQMDSNELAEQTLNIIRPGT
jgi:hypothetical protein